MNVFEQVADFCHENLLEDIETLSYLRDKRGLSDATLAKFRIGLFPKDGMRSLFKRVEAKTLREHGIIRNASSSVFRVWNLVVSILDVRGQAIALAGRTLLNEAERAKRGIPKYMNTVYPKTHHLYGLNFAKREIAQRGMAYVVEGYFDVMSAHQHGLGNVVACCGVAFSRRQLSLLARYTPNVVLLLDNDKAGQANAVAHVREKQASGISLEAKNPFPLGIKDLDEFLLSRPAEDILLALSETNEYGHIRTIW